MLLNLQIHPTFLAEARLVTLERGRECFVGLTVLLVYAQDDPNFLFSLAHRDLRDRVPGFIILNVCTSSFVFNKSFKVLFFKFLTHLLRFWPFIILYILFFLSSFINPNMFI